MFIQTEETPNPDTLKFLPGQEIAPDQPRDFADRAAAAGSPLARELFAVEGVARVFAGADFISVTKASDVDWPHLKPAILGAIMDALESGERLFADADLDVADGEEAGLIREIKEILDTRVRPAVARDGGDIVFHSYDENSGRVYLHMRGACAGCPSSALTLKQGIENLLKHYVPEVSGVEAVA